MYRKSDASQELATIIGANLKYLRLKKKIFSPMKMVSYAIGVSYQQMAKYESGLNIPCAYRLKQFSDYYKVSLDDLVNANYIHEQTKGNEILDKALTPQDAGYLKPQPDIGSLEELKEASDGNI